MLVYFINHKKPIESKWCERSQLATGWSTWTSNSRSKWSHVTKYVTWNVTKWRISKQPIPATRWISNPSGKLSWRSTKTRSAKTRRSRTKFQSSVTFIAIIAYATYESSGVATEQWSKLSICPPAKHSSLYSTKLFISTWWSCAANNDSDIYEPKYASSRPTWCWSISWSPWWRIHVASKSKFWSIW